MQSYANRQGSGPRLGGIITFASDGVNWLNNPLNLLDGDSASGNTWWSVVSGIGYFQYDFGEPRLITASRWKQQTADTHGVWRWRGSNDNATWTDIGATFTLGGAQVSTQSMAGNTTAYRYYRMAFVSGGISSSPYLYQIEFLIDDGASNTQTFGTMYGSGDRRALIDVSATIALGGTAPVNSIISGENSTSRPYFGGSTGALKFDFKKPIVLDFGRIFMSGAAAQGDWQWQGSNDDASWANVGGVFAFAPTGAYGVFHQDFDTLVGNLASYRYWRMQIVGGSTSSLPNINSITFRTNNVETDALWDDVILRQTFDVDFSDVSKVGRPVASFNNAASAVPSISAPAKFGKSLNCDYYGQGLKTPGVDFRFGAGDFTVEFWVYRPTSGGPYGSLLMGLYEVVNGQRAWRIATSPGANPTVSVAFSTDGNSALVNDTTTATLDIDKWTHICLERASGVFRLYKNGVMAWKNAAISAALFPATGDLRIGGPTDISTPSNSGFLRFDDVRVTKGKARYGSDAGFGVSFNPLPVLGRVPAAAAVVQAKSAVFVDSSLAYTVTLGKPPVEGNWLVCMVAMNGSIFTAPSPAPGWTLRYGTSEGQPQEYASPAYYYRRVPAGASATQTASVGNSQGADSATMYEISGLGDTPSFANEAPNYRAYEYGSPVLYNQSLQDIVPAESVIALGHFGLREGVIDSVAELAGKVPSAAAGNRQCVGAFGTKLPGEHFRPAVSFSTQGNYIGVALLLIPFAGGTPPDPDPNVTVKPTPGAMQLSGKNPTVFVANEVRPSRSGMKVWGLVPTISLNPLIRPAPGVLNYTGLQPTLSSAFGVEAPAGRLIITGKFPTAVIGDTVTPPRDALTITGAYPILLTRFASFVSQQASLALGKVIPVAGVSQQASLTLGKVIPPSRVSQQASLTLGKVVPPIKVTQQSSSFLVKRVIQPAVLPEPELGGSETWEWKTDVITRDDGSEQRIALRDFPRRSFSETIIYDDQALVNRHVQFMLDRTGGTFVLPLYHYRIRPAKALKAGDRSIFFDTSRMDIAVGKYLYVHSSSGFQLCKVEHLYPDSAYVDLTVLKDYDDDVTIMPCAVCVASNNTSFDRLNPDYYGSMDLNAAEVVLNAPFVRPANAKTLLRFTDLPILTELAVGKQFDNGHNVGLELTDFDTGPVSLRNAWKNGQNVFARKFFVNRRRPEDLDWWKLMADYAKGSQKPFLMPSGRGDFEIVKPALPGGDRIVVDGIRYGPSFFGREAFRRVAIQSAAGTHYATVWSAARDGDTNVLYFQPAYPTGPGWDKKQKVSFLMKVRINDDKVQLTHHALHSFVDISFKTVDDE